jgi:hypothetical protein
MFEKQFIEHGYFVTEIPDLLDRIPILISKFENLIINAEYLGSLGHVKIRKSDLELMKGNGWSWGCDHIYSPELRSQELLDLASLEPIPTMIHRILGDRVKWTGGHGHWSPETYDYYLHWHRDTRRHLWRNGNPNSRCHVQVCIALAEESVIRIVPSSHLRDLDSWEYRYIDVDIHENHPDQLVIKIPAGSALFFNTYTLHRAYCSKNSIRRALHFGFTSADAEIEPGRVGKCFDWLSDVNFINAQSTFLKKCINEQLASQF